MRKKANVGADRDSLTAFLDKELRTAAFNDASCNGLQVQGSASITRIGLAVDACLEAYEAAARRDCRMLIVHHGMIWGGITSITNAAYRQIKFLFDHDISLYASHLPLDAHPEHGNNAQLARCLGVTRLEPFGDYKGIAIGFEGMLPRPLGRDALSEKIERLLGSSNVVLPFGKNMVRRLAVVSGGAGEIIEEAARKGVDCYVTGDPNHHHHHLAKEAALNVIYCGHYHSEKLGVQAIGRLLEKKFGVACEFLDIPTIV